MFRRRPALLVMPWILFAPCALAQEDGAASVAEPPAAVDVTNPADAERVALEQARAELAEREATLAAQRKQLDAARAELAEDRAELKDDRQELARERKELQKQEEEEAQEEAKGPSFAAIGTVSSGTVALIASVGVVVAALLAVPNPLLYDGYRAELKVAQANYAITPRVEDIRAAQTARANMRAVENGLADQAGVLIGAGAALVPAAVSLGIGVFQLVSE
jgi:hypothetical protein